MVLRRRTSSGRRDPSRGRAWSRRWSGSRGRSGCPCSPSFHQRLLQTLAAADRPSDDEHVAITAGQLLHLAQQRDRLPRQRDDVRLGLLGVALVAHLQLLERHAPDRRVEIDVRPFGVLDLGAG